MNELKGTFASVFSGGGGFDAGVVGAGWEPVWAIEYDRDIAGSYRENFGNHIIVENILNINVATYLELMLILLVDWIHFSPPCTNASVANNNAGETELDIALARKIAEFIEVLKPRIVTLENVYTYRDFESWTIIATALLKNGYSLPATGKGKHVANYFHCCTANWGVPQTRTRMIAVARRDGITPSLPPATHAENPVVGLFGKKEKWVGWYASIQDLVPSLPDSQFAQWQLNRLPAKIADHFLPHTQVNSGTLGKFAEQPATTIGAEKPPDRALLVEGHNMNGGKDADADEPAQSVTTSHPPRAFIAPDHVQNMLECGNCGHTWDGEDTNTCPNCNKPDVGFIVPGGNATSFSPRNANEPSRTVGDTEREGNVPRAFIVDDGNSKKGTVKDREAPMATVRTQQSGGTAARAFIIDGKLSTLGRSKILQVHDGEETTVPVVSSPSAFRDTRAFIVQSANSKSNGGIVNLPHDPARTVDTGSPPKALTNGRVVKMTPRALARFQSFPDWYKLPTCTEKKTARKRKTYLVNGGKPDETNPWVVEYLHTDDTLACKIIGNAVPSLFARRLAESLL